MSYIPGAGGQSALTPPPAAASLTAVNVTTATIADSAVGLFINAPDISNSHGQWWLKALASGAYTLVVRLVPMLLSSNFNCGGLALRDSGGGKLISFEQNVLTGVQNVAIVQWADANTRSVNAYTHNTGGTLFPWLKIHDDGTTNRTYSVSQEGVNWLDILTEGRTTYLGVAPNQAGLMVCAQGQPTAMTVSSWAGA